MQGSGLGSLNLLHRARGVEEPFTCLGVENLKKFLANVVDLRIAPTIDITYNRSKVRLFSIILVNGWPKDKAIAIIING